MINLDTRIKVAIVEDDPEIRMNLSLIINAANDLICEHNFESAELFLKEVGDVAPDVVLMDIQLPKMNGIEAVRELKSRYRHIEVLMLTVHQNDKLVFDSLCAGASGYLVKNTPPAKIVDAIQEALRGGAPMSSQVARMVVRSFRQNQDNLLTQRERDVLEQLCEGKSYRSIGDTLFISQDTVRSHIKSIYKKLEVNSKSEAVAKALRTRII
ncbi:MAG: response regulator transcription factor [Roseivirga sp.]|nr:response regulator transcription factor [Roseivirga sp.]